MLPFPALRRAMVDNQIRTFDVSDKAVLAAMSSVPREQHVPAGFEALAYSDRNIVLPGDPADPRVVLAPMVLARLIQALDVQAGERALTVADEGGYAGAVLTAMGATVSSEGPAPSDGPASAFDLILVNGAVEMRPEALLARLADRGRLVCLLSDGRAGKATLFIRSGEAFSFRSLFDANAPILAAFRKPAAFAF